MNPPNLIKNADDIQVKLCCGCGIVNLAVGPVMMRMTKEVMLELATTFNQVVDSLNEKTKPEAKADPIVHETAGNVYQLIPGKFFA